MDRNSKIELITLLEEKERREKFRKLSTYYPEKGLLCRAAYPKHLRHFDGGAKFRERLFLGGNRVGKSDGGGVEIAYHLTGEYPHWWKGKRFELPNEWWAAGNTSKTTRDIIQKKLFGSKDSLGTGLIPGHLIVGTPTAKSGTPDAIDTARIRHKTGGISVIQFKSYDQRRTAFEGTKQDGIWLDEEPPLDIYTECLLRTTDTTGSGQRNGIIILTFTPLMGMSETVLQFLPGGVINEKSEGSKMVTIVGWDDVPHLTAETKAELLASIPPFQRDARTKGIPALGAGAIYPVPESDFVIDDMKIADHWLRSYGMDVGWNRTAVAWSAYDRETDILYIAGEHYRGQAEPSIHADAIKSRGEWIPGVCDPAARGRGQKDGEQLMQIYRDLGLDITPAVNAVEAGIYEVWQRMSSGRLKVFRSCQNWLNEFRLYRRDEKGHIVKGSDHLMDATRYDVMSGIARAKAKPSDKKKIKNAYRPSSGGGNGWMG
jgi:phage terminase large subunit-like protein